jgi:two-component system sensor histidine kinase AlgZ
MTKATLPLPQREPIKLLTICLFSFFVWIMIAVSHAIGVILDDAEVTPHTSAVLVLFQYILIFLPLAICNCLFAWIMWIKIDLMLRPTMMVISGLLLITIGIPLVVSNKIIVSLMLENRPLTLFLSEWRVQSTVIMWIDLCLLLLSYFVQLSFAFWRRGLIKEGEFIDAKSESLELRLQLLQGQLKPHFLFNALNSISALVRGQDRRLAGKALKQLHCLLAYVVHASKHEWLTVQDELDFVRDYLELQVLRFGNRMTIIWDIENATWDHVACPPLLFQPLVENAIHHGVENHHEHSNIQISLHVVTGNVRFCIVNTLVDCQKKSQGHGLGIRITKERLAILYDGQATMSSTQTKQEFLAEVVFPVRPELAIAS